jgi:hypothetical protein
MDRRYRVRKYERFSTPIADLFLLPVSAMTCMCRLQMSHIRVNALTVNVSLLCPTRERETDRDVSAHTTRKLWNSPSHHIRLSDSRDAEYYLIAVH